jgi:hypothetical protein
MLAIDDVEVPPPPDPEPLCVCGYDLRGSSDNSQCPECGRPVAEALAYFAWDFPTSSLLTLRRGIVLALGFFLAFIPAVAVFACLSHVNGWFIPLAWLLPPLLPAMSIVQLTQPLPGMSWRDRVNGRQLRFWTSILLAGACGRFAYELQSAGAARYSASVGFAFDDHFIRTLDGLLAIIGIWWARLLCRLLADVARRLDWSTMALAVDALWFWLALAWMGSVLPDAIYWQWLDGPMTQTPVEQFLRALEGGSAVALSLDVELYAALLMGYWIALNLASRGIDHHNKLRTQAVRRVW